MKRDCSTCVYKEGSCYPSKTIFDKDKTCYSYNPDYEGYISDLEKENAELKLKLEALEGQTPWKDIKDKSEVIGKLTKAKTYLKYFIEILKKLRANKEPLVIEAEQFLKEI